MAPPADEDGLNEESDERPAPGNSDGVLDIAYGDKPSGKTKPSGGNTKTGKRSKKKKKTKIIKKNKISQDQHKTHDRIITHPHGKNK